MVLWLLQQVALIYIPPLARGSKSNLVMKGYRSNLPGCETALFSIQGIHSRKLSFYNLICISIAAREPWLIPALSD